MQQDFSKVAQSDHTDWIGAAYLPVALMLILI